MNLLIVVAGPARSGKSSLIAAAIVHAHRLANGGARFEPGFRRRAAPALAATGADLWSALERRAIATGPDVAELAGDLWRHWLADPPPPSQEADAGGSPFSVTTVAGDLMGFEAGETITLVEVAADLFLSLGRAQPRGLAERRLFTALLTGDAVVLCLPSARSWRDAEKSAVEAVAATLRGRAADLTLALTLSDLPLTAHALERQACPDPDDPFSADFVQQTLGADDGRRPWLERLRDAADARIQFCSSYGLLRRSRTPNVDLAPLWSAGGVDPFGPLRPLWPPASPREQAYPLEDWLPLGALEALFGDGPR